MKPRNLALAAVMLSGCGTDVVRPRDVISSGLLAELGVTRVVDPVYGWLSASMSHNTGGTVGPDSVTFTVTPGNGTPPYEYVFAVEICDIHDLCSGYMELQTSPSNTWTYHPPSYAAYMRFRAQVREAHPANYFTGVTSNVIFIRGDAWPNYGSGGPVPTILCGGSFRYGEWNTSPESTRTISGYPPETSYVHNPPYTHYHTYSRNWCSGKRSKGHDSMFHPPWAS